MNIEKGFFFRMVSSKPAGRCRSCWGCGSYGKYGSWGGGCRNCGRYSTCKSYGSYGSLQELWELRSCGACRRYCANYDLLRVIGNKDYHKSCVRFRKKSIILDVFFKPKKIWTKPSPIDYKCPLMATWGEVNLSGGDIRGLPLTSPMLFYLKIKPQDLATFRPK